MLHFILWIAFVWSSIFVHNDCEHNSATVSHAQWEDGSAMVILTMNDDMNVITKVWTIDAETGYVNRSNTWPTYFTGEYVVPSKENGWISDHFYCRSE